jgi:hypothetical protein
LDDLIYGLPLVLRGESIKAMAMPFRVRRRRETDAVAEVESERMVHLFDLFDIKFEGKTKFITSKFDTYVKKYYLAVETVEHRQSEVSFPNREEPRLNLI